MINLIPPGIDFLGILGIEYNELKELVIKSKNFDDFFESLDIDKCIEQFELNEYDSFKLNENILNFSYYNYKKIKEYIRLGKADMLGDYGYIDELKMKELINEVK